MRFATGTGRFAFDIARVRREVAVRNVLERLQPEGGRPEAESIARESYAVMTRTFVDLLRGGRLGDEELWGVLSRSGMEELKHSLTKDGGSLVVSGHFGNWELAIQGLRRLGVSIAALAADMANPRVNERVMRARRAAGIEPLSPRRDLRGVVRHLEGGGCVVTLMDQDARGKGVFIDFLGTPASTHGGIVSLAMRTGAPLVFGALVDEGDTYTLVPHEVWRPDPSLDEVRNRRDGAVRFNRYLESLVLRWPTNYFWAHRRWKTRPPDGGATPSAPRGEEPIRGGRGGLATSRVRNAD
jgi:KDO2-lipid IV(A) lauroyltransferase